MDLTATLVVAGSLLSIAALCAWRLGRGDIPALPIHGDFPSIPEELKVGDRNSRGGGAHRPPTFAQDDVIARRHGDASTR